tara:strand:+ start:240 stop:1025 length:786 start_codon:yes stop_codon:yes gene_type:complete
MKIKEILSGTKKRLERGSRKSRKKGKSLIKKLREGGKIFPNALPFDHAKIPALMKQINSVLSKTGAKAIPIGSGATPTKGKISGDLDMVVDMDQLKQHFNMEDAEDKIIRQKLEQLFGLAGFTTKKSGTSVHVEVPDGNETHQIDIMVVPNAETASKFHTHSIPQGSKFKGANKMIAIAKLAGYQNKLWSPYQGLFSRDENGKKADFISSDLDEIARTLIGPNASRKDLGSVESIMAALGKEKGDALLADLRGGANWKELD